MARGSWRAMPKAAPAAAEGLPATAPPWATGEAARQTELPIPREIRRLEIRHPEAPRAEMRHRPALGTAAGGREARHDRITSPHRRARACRGHPRLSLRTFSEKGVDGRDKTGHDSGEMVRREPN